MFDIKNPNSFLGGQNVHNLIIIGLLIFIIYRIINKGSIGVDTKESSLTSSKCGGRGGSPPCCTGYKESGGKCIRDIIVG
jgi:hypothetical protein